MYHMMLEDFTQAFKCKMTKRDTSQIDLILDQKKNNDIEIKSNRNWLDICNEV